MTKLKVGTWERMAVDEAKAQAGRGWDLLSPALREALVARALIGIAFAQAESTLEKNPALGHFVNSARAALASVNPIPM